MIQKSVLDNGIRILSEKIPAVRSVAAGIWIETGARHESSHLSGISHFVEHMLFKGTERRSALAIAKEIDSVGGVLNGFTGREYTCYFAKVLGEKLPLAIDLLADLVRNPVLDPGEIEKERRVVLQELGMLEDTPDELVHDLFTQTFWGDHPLGQPILGTPSSIEGLTGAHLRDFIRERHCGDRLVVAAAGNIDHQRLVDLVVAGLGSLPLSSTDTLDVAPEFGRHVSIVPRDLEQVHLCLGTRLLPQDHPNRFAAYLFSTILGGGMSSRLFQKVREDLGLAYSIYSVANAHSDAGSLVVYAGVAPDDARRTVSEILKELRRMRIEPVSAEELTAAKDQLQGNILLALENSDTCMSMLARNEIYLGRIFPVRELQRGIEKVTVEDLQRLAEFIVQDDYLTLQVLGRAQEEDFPNDLLTVNLP